MSFVSARASTREVHPDERAASNVARRQAAEAERKDRIMNPKIRQFGVRDEGRSGAHNRNTTMTNNNTSWQQQGIHYQIL